MITPIADWLTLDEQGMIMPWYTRPCLEWLVTLDLKGKDIFEYGCGNSTLWYRSKGANVVGIDDNIEWAEKAGVYYVNNKFFPLEAYVEPISDHAKLFDIVVVDGSYRDECAAKALKFIKPGGFLIIDNWEQPSVEPNVWTKTKELIKDLRQTVYKEPTHADWHSLVVINDNRASYPGPFYAGFPGVGINNPNDFEYFLR